MTDSVDRIARARMERERARKQLASSLGALQQRLRPGTLMSNAWDGMREKSGEIADDAVQAVKNRPLAVSGMGAAILLFIAREPLRRFVSGLLSRDDGSESEDDIITARLADDDHYDLTAPTVERSRHEGVKA